jgi:hypothetical protein
MTRPISITVIAWVIIALSLEGLIGLAGGFVKPLITSGTITTPFSLSTTTWLGAANLVVYVILAALLLRGIGWARVVYVCLLSIGLVGMLLGKQPASIAVITGLKIAVFSYFFFRRESNDYFSKLAVQTV